MIGHLLFYMMLCFVGVAPRASLSKIGGAPPAREILRWYEYVWVRCVQFFTISSNVEYRPINKASTPSLILSLPKMDGMGMVGNPSSKVDVQYVANSIVEFVDVRFSFNDISNRWGCFLPSHVVFPDIDTRARFMNRPGWRRRPKKDSKCSSTKSKLMPQHKLSSILRKHWMIRPSQQVIILWV